MDNRFLGWTCLTLVIIGAINWGLVGFFQFDLISAIFGGMSAWISRVIYALIGLAGLYSIVFYDRLSTDNSERLTARDL